MVTLERKILRPILNIIFKTSFKPNFKATIYVYNLTLIFKAVLRLYFDVYFIVLRSMFEAKI
jgi:hypothetical protein